MGRAEHLLALPQLIRYPPNEETGSWFAWCVVPNRQLLACKRSVNPPEAAQDLDARQQGREDAAAGAIAEEPSLTCAKQLRR